MKTATYTFLAASLLALSAGAAAQGDFTLKMDNAAADGGFTAQQLLSKPYGFGCSGGNLSPAFSWKNAPAGTKSFVLTIHDKDAPTGIGWMHWVVANIPAKVNSLPAGISAKGGKLPKGALQTRTDFGSAGYGGAAPPNGESHRYQFTVHALDVESIEVDEGSSGALVGFNVHFHSLGSATLTVMFN